MDQAKTLKMSFQIVNVPLPNCPQTICALRLMTASLTFLLLSRPGGRPAEDKMEAGPNNVLSNTVVMYTWCLQIKEKVFNS